MPRRRSFGKLVSDSDENQLIESPPSHLVSDSRQKVDDWFGDLYAELRRSAAVLKRNDVNAAISTSTLLHETWLKFAVSSGTEPESELHFKRKAACVMRHVLRDAARRRRANKRGGDGLFVTLNDSLELPVSSDDDLLRLDVALDAFADASPRQAELVTLRFFGGMNNSEIATTLGISERTVERDWRASRAWLAAEIHKMGPSKPV